MEIEDKETNECYTTDSKEYLRKYRNSLLQIKSMKILKAMEKDIYSKSKIISWVIKGREEGFLEAEDIITTKHES